MEKKKQNWIWWRILLLCLGITILLIGITWATLFFTDTDKGEENYTSYIQGERITHYFPNPDRLIIKEADRNEYYIITNQEKEYVTLVQLLDEAIDNAEGIQDNDVEQTELDNMEQSGNFLMLDYNRVSKNYILDRNNGVMIRYKEDGGVKVRQQMDLTNLNEKIESVIKEKKTYPLEGRILASTPQTIEGLPVSAIRQLGDKKLEDKGNGIYQMKITSIQELQTMQDLLGVDVISQNQNMTEEFMQDHSIILTVTNHDIVSVQDSLRKIEYDYTYDTISNYNVQFYLVSKAVNADCIYNTVPKSNRVEKENGMQADGTYYTNAYLPNYRVYSDYTINQETANRLGFSKQQDNSYTVPIKTNEQLAELNKTLKLYGFDTGGSSHYNDMNVEDEYYQYILCVKNITGHFEASVKGRYDYVNGANFDMTNLIIETAELTDSAAKTKLQGNLIAIPKEVTYQNIVIEKTSGYDDTFSNNTRKLSANDAKIKAKDILGTEDSQAFLDVLSGQTPFGSYFLVPEDTCRRIWIVVSEKNYMPTAVAVDATTGEILASNELGC